MSAAPDPLEWLALRIALVAVASIVAVVGVVWKIRDSRLPPPPTRLEQTIRCLHGEKGLDVVSPAGDPVSSTAGDGSLKTKVEGNGAVVSLASSVEQAKKIFRYYHALGGDLEGKLERRGLTVYLWERTASPTQRQGLYDCEY